MLVTVLAFGRLYTDTSAEVPTVAAKYTNALTSRIFIQEHPYMLFQYMNRAFVIDFYYN
jgi:hypothetical protein